MPMTLDGESGVKTPRIDSEGMNVRKPKRRGEKQSNGGGDMVRRAEPRVIDFGRCGHWDHRVFANALPRPTDVNGPTTFTIGKDGQLKAHTKPVPDYRMRRARRILWECQQRPERRYKPSMFFRHPSLKNTPYLVLKRLVEESEEQHG